MTENTDPTPLEPSDKNPGIVSTLEAVLRRPGSIIHHLEKSSPGPIILLLILCSASSLLVFGFVVGTFSMGQNLWVSPLKIIGGLFFASILCLPSLYIFSYLSDLEFRPATIAGVLATVVCLASLLLVGFAPVVWIFSQSTESVAFVGGLNLVVWIIAVWFGLGILSKSALALGGTRVGHLRVWMTIFLLVTFQMTTTLRPIVDEQDLLFNPEKKFFLAHWFECLSDRHDP